MTKLDRGFWERVALGLFDDSVYMLIISRIVCGPSDLKHLWESPTSTGVIND
jgi:hypothetical protein